MRDGGEGDAGGSKPAGRRNGKAAKLKHVARSLLASYGATSRSAIIRVPLSIALVVGLQTLDKIVNVRYQTALGSLLDTFLTKDPKAFKHIVRRVLALGTATHFLGGVAFVHAQEVRVATESWLTTHILKAYLSPDAFYRVTVLGARSAADAEDDDDTFAGIEQQVSELVPRFVHGAVNNTIDLIASVLAFGSQIRVLNSASPYLAGGTLAYASAAGLFVQLAGTAFGRLVVQHRTSDATFRYTLARLNENAEAIAFYRGEAAELRAVEEAHASVVHARRRLHTWAASKSMGEDIIALGTHVLPLGILAPQFFSDELSKEELQECLACFRGVQRSGGDLLNSISQVSEFYANAGRLGTLLATLEAARKQCAPDDSEPAIRITEIDMAGGGSEGAGYWLEVKALTLHRPVSTTDDRTLAPLVRGLNLTLRRGEKVLITGASGAGKTTLLRALAGLWRAGSGTVAVPPVAEVVFLPQRPYVTTGSVKAQLLYPRAYLRTSNPHSPARRQSEAADAQLCAALTRLGLEKLCPLLHEELPLAQLLSGGELQRLSIARVLVNKPRFAIVDEATASLDGEAECMCYDILAETCEAFVSVAHRHEAVARYHTFRIHLAGGGDTSVTRLPAEGGAPS